MAFRFFLVGAVAALGVDLPRGIDVESLAHSGRAWWHARVAEFEARRGIARAEVEEPRSEAPVVAPEVVAPDVDAAFATVIEDVVAAFAADGHTDRVEGSFASSPLVAGVEDVAYGPDFADALNRWADGLSEPAEPAAFVLEANATESDVVLDPIVAPISGTAGSAFAVAGEVDEGPSPTESLTASAVSEADGTDEPSSQPRLVKAVQLTGQALQAWLALVQPATPSSVPTP